MKLTHPYKWMMGSVLAWRETCREGLRTPIMLTQEMQEKFYDEVICDRHSVHRYWAIVADKADPHGATPLLGLGGLTNIQWENRIAEISLIMDPNVHGKGEEAVDLLLEEAFERMGLKTVCGECYVCNTKAHEFWWNIARKYHCIPPMGVPCIHLPNRKFWNGKFWDGYYFSIDVDAWRKIHAFK